jgi:predicted PurR-regulated permease PerM
LTFAALLAMLLLPLSMRLQGRGVSKGWAALFSVLVFLALFALVVSVLSWQISDVSKNASQIEHNINERIQQFREYISRTFRISAQTQAEIMQSQQSYNGRVAGIISSILSSVGSFLVSFTLTIVYAFLFLYFRDHLKKFIIQLVPLPEKQNAQEIISEARKVAQKYITGIAWMIVCLWIMYSIGFSIVGVNNAVFYAILCGLLEIVPFIGNFTGSMITVIAVIMQQGSSSMIAGVIFTYSTIQFLQTYILEPLVVGKGVSINPLFTIAGIVGGELLWGIPGMVLAIPLLGITKIICDHIEVLKPYGYLIGDDKKINRSMLERVKQWVK